MRPVMPIQTGYYLGGDEGEQGKKPFQMGRYGRESEAARDPVCYSFFYL
jgi:hypothetical protein